MERAESDDHYPRIHCFSTFFYPKVSRQGHSSVKRWTRKVDLFSLDRILFPIHLGVHWTIAAALIKEKEIIYIDSMGGENKKCQDVLLDYLKTEHEIRKKSPLPEGWTTRSLSNKAPQQNNSSDCGVFCCKFGDYISRGFLEFNFSAEDMKTFRKAICYEISINDFVA
jgi:sentrin-specific protease 1